MPVRGVEHLLGEIGRVLDHGAGFGEPLLGDHPNRVRRRGLGAALNVRRATVHPVDPVARRARQFVAPA